MMRSLYSAVSGLKTHQTKMDVIGNNIANVNTVAFKSSSVTFSEIMYQTISNASGASTTTGLGGKNAKQIGLGVATGATTVSVTSAGAAQTTGNPFDIKLTDSNSTNFFIVNNGSENLFTRAGSFYIDGTGNLCMSSTGYTLLGWQVDDTGNIKKDTVSALRIMQEKNLTSPPEATTNGTVAGVIDKNDTNVSSDTGYVMNLNFYDKLGYQYTAKFSVHAVDTETGNYAVELMDILDSDGKSILSEYLKTGELSDIFGTANYSLPKAGNTPSDANIRYLTQEEIDSGKYTMVEGVNSAGWYYMAESVYVNATTTLENAYIPLTMDMAGDSYNTTNKYYATSDPTSEIVVTGNLTDLFDVTAEQLATASITDERFPNQIVLQSSTSAYTLKFSEADGTFQYVNEKGNDTVMLNLTALGDKFADITVDFTQTKNYDNGGSSTLSMDAGAPDGKTGVGKALGTLTGVTVDNSGKIYGSYDNGNTVLLGQIAVAQFANASGLEKVGENCYRKTLNSGDFDGIGVEISADGSSMSTGELEMSNVDLSAEFTDMIVTQRGFQANSRVITTSDTLLEELINLKR